MNWLLLRGLAREQRHWGRFRDELEARSGEGARVHTLDLPGMGTECRRASPLSIRGITEDVRARWLALGAKEPTGLVAISLGGMLALDWMARYPADFSRLVLINSSVGGLSPVWHRLDPRGFRYSVRIPFARTRSEKERLSLLLTTRMLDEERMGSIVREWTGYAEECPATGLNVLRQLLAASRFRTSEKIASPVMVMVGEGDLMVNPCCSRTLARHLGARLLAHPRAGHDLPTDDPVWVAERISGWKED